MKGSPLVYMSFVATKTRILQPGTRAEAQACFFDVPSTPGLLKLKFPATFGCRDAFVAWLYVGISTKVGSHQYTLSH